MPLPLSLPSPIFKSVLTLSSSSLLPLLFPDFSTLLDLMDLWVCVPLSLPVPLPLDWKKKIKKKIKEGLDTSCTKKRRRNINCNMKQALNNHLEKHIKYHHTIIKLLSLKLALFNTNLKRGYYSIFQEKYYISGREVKKTTKERTEQHYTRLWANIWIPDQKVLRTYTMASPPNVLPEVLKLILSNRLHQKVNSTLWQTLEDETHWIMRRHHCTHISTEGIVKRLLSKLPQTQHRWLLNTAVNEMVMGKITYWSQGHFSASYGS